MIRSTVIFGLTYLILYLFNKNFGLISKVFYKGRNMLLIAVVSAIVVLNWSVYFLIDKEVIQAQFQPDFYALFMALALFIGNCFSKEKAVKQ